MDTALLLAIDTCGATGSVALGRFADGKLGIAGQRPLEGRTYSARLTTELHGLLADAGAQLADLTGVVAVSGPGSFTGVRIGLSTVKGLAEGLALPVVSVSRLALMAASSGCVAAALDAHRNEVFLRVSQPGGAPDAVAELLAGVAELAALAVPAQVAVAEESAARLLTAAWPGAALLRVAAPTAADALRVAAPRLLAGAAEDLVLLDGHYLRRSDAEIFGDKKAAEKQAAAGHGATRAPASS